MLKEGFKDQAQVNEPEMRYYSRSPNRDWRVLPHLYLAKL